MLDDLRGATDAHGNVLAVTVPAPADEIAVAGDLVKGKADGVPVAVLRGLRTPYSRPGSTGPGRGRWCGTPSTTCSGWGLGGRAGRRTGARGADRSA